MYEKCIKRILDIIFALMLMPVILPIIVICGMFIKFEDRGPVFYKGYRLGKDKKVFKMFKLRSMKVNAPDIRNEDGSTFNSDSDPRLTRIGRFLRKTSLDELPQIFNVIIGDMSFIGPRPDLAEQLEIYKLYNKDMSKFTVRPGITGYAQCNGRNKLLWDEKLKLDRYYIENCSFILDFKIIIKTIQEVFFSRGINSGDKGVNISG